MIASANLQIAPNIGYPIRGWLVSSEGPEVGGIWPEVGGKPLPINVSLINRHIRENLTIYF